jgi:transposase
MAKSLSEDLRLRLIASVEAGMSRRAAAERFGVSASSAVRWMSAWRRSGAARGKRQGGDRRSQRVEAFAAIILAAVAKKVDITLIELADLLRTQHGVVFAPSTLWRFLDRHSMTLKKNGARRRADQARRRRTAPALGRNPIRA